ncbi:hypothetical protein ACIBG8_16140 [Nonomuraea sp. NPDC050556]|uniref:hypothetical protein n=1 Tax=Nonomuraea sp. NPDC050556 TaxID=3364369 RepID=UPI0037A90999
MSNRRSGRFLLGAALVATLGGAAFGALPVYASASSHQAADYPPPPPPDPYGPYTPPGPEPTDDATPGSEDPLAFDPSSLQVTGTVGTRVTASLTVTGSYGLTVTYTVLDRSKLPPGVTIGADGRITGTPTAPGTFTVPVKACAGTECAQGSIIFTVKPSPWTLTVTFTGVAGQPSSGTIRVNGLSTYGSRPTYTVTEPGKLPPGITVTADGRIVGTPTKPGTYTFPVKVCSGGTCTTLSVTLTVGQPVAPDWTVNITFDGALGRPVKGQITVTGTPYGARPTFTVTDPGKLPPGITVGPDGRITGTPVKAGTYTFTVRICSGTTCMETEVTITVAGQSTTLSLVVDGFNGTVDKPATGQITATGAPYGTTVTYTVTDPGKLPPGITISTDGRITGTPTKAGTYVVPVKVCLGSGCAATTITLTVGSSTQMLIVLTGFSGYVGQQVTGRYILETAPGATFTVLDATKLPPGITIGADGRLSGVPKVKGSFTFPVRVCLGTACGDTTLTITILASAPTYGTVTTTEVTVTICSCGDTNLALPTQFGTGFTVVDPSNLPPGISVSSGGLITGHATVPGTYMVLIKVGNETWKTTFVVGAGEPEPAPYVY